MIPSLLGAVRGSGVTGNWGDSVSASASENFSFQAMIFTALLFPVYVFAASLTNSAAILTDLLATLFDLIALTTCWLVLRLAQNAQAGKYAYGLGKLENLAELIIALLQTVLATIAGTYAIVRILHPEPLVGSEIGLIVTAAAALGNVILNRKAARLASQTRSPVLVAQARVHLISAISSGSVFTVTAILSIFDEIPLLYHLDPIGSFIVIGFMIYNVHAMLTNSMGSLLDQAIDETGQLRILKVLAAHFHDYNELGDIRTRQIGGKMFVELHLGFEAGWTVAKAQDIVATLTGEVKREFREAGDDVQVAIVLIPRSMDADAPAHS